MIWYEWLNLKETPKKYGFWDHMFDVYFFLCLRGLGLENYKNWSCLKGPLKKILWGDKTSSATCVAGLGSLPFFRLDGSSNPTQPGLKKIPHRDRHPTW